MFLWNLMTASSDSDGSGLTTIIFLGIAVLMIGGMVFFNSRSNKKRQAEVQETLNALKPGCNVKTIGGICGVVVEVDHVAKTFVLETGDEAHGKSYMKFDMIAIYQTDAKKEAAPAEEVAEAPAEEAPVEETSTEDKE